MAIEFAAIVVHGRRHGHSAVAGAAYRARDRLVDERSGEVYDFRRKATDLAHCEIMLPEGADPRLGDRHHLWNTVELAEKRKDAQLARDLRLALPKELDKAHHLALVRSFVKEQLHSHGVVADIALHAHERNPHAHVYMTTRVATAEGLGGKARSLNGAFIGGRKLPDEVQWRHRWAEHQNRYFERHRMDLTVINQEGVFAVQPKLGKAAGMEARGEITRQGEALRKVREENLARLEERPELVFDALTVHNATFTRNDVARELARHVDDAGHYQRLLVRLDASSERVDLSDTLDSNRADQAPQNSWQSRGRATTTAMLEIEKAMVTDARLLGRTGGFAAGYDQLQAALQTHVHLSGEQRTALQHAAGREQLAVVVGLAGSGKSTMLAGLREAYETDGRRVQGIALSGIAARGLKAGAGIESRTLASFERAVAASASQEGNSVHQSGWRHTSTGHSNGKSPGAIAGLRAGDVLVVDEAGMIGSRAMQRLLAHSRAARLKVVLVGDDEQLQPIEAGAPLRAIREQVGVVELATVRRQVQDRSDADPDWMRRASLDFAKGRTERALEAYRTRDRLGWRSTRQEAIQGLSRAFVADYRPIQRQDNLPGRSGQDETLLILAHARVDVRALNEAVRNRLRAAGRLGDEAVVTTAGGERQLAVGEPLMFLRNDRQLGVSNGMLGRVVGLERTEASGSPALVAAAGSASTELPTIRSLTVEIDGDDGPRRIGVDPAAYDQFDHGYAATIHKSQGVTVDRSYVLASPGMDRHLSYVAMTRHRRSVLMLAGREDFAGGGRGDPQARLVWRLSRARLAENALDFAARRDLGEAREWLRDGLGQLAEGGRWLNRQLRETVRAFMAERLARQGLSSESPADGLWRAYQHAQRALDKALNTLPRDALGMTEMDKRRLAMADAARAVLAEPKARAEAEQRDELAGLRQAAMMQPRQRDIGQTREPSRMRGRGLEI